MSLTHIIVLLVTGVGVGFGSGLLGVGGSFIMTPVQYIVYTSMGIPIDVAVKLAFGTSLLVILPTTISGAWRHNKQGAVWWKAAAIMGGCGLAVAFGGATLATQLPGEMLKIVFGGVVIAAGIRMLVAQAPEAEEKPKDNPWLWVAWSVPIGMLTGILGLGGGVLAVPVMVMALKFRMHNAIATSLAMIIFTSIGGVIGYIVNGLGAPDLPPYSVGYVNLPTWALLAATSVGMAQVGAMTTRRIPARQLRYIFVGIMFYVGLRMLGVFTLLGAHV